MICAIDDCDKAVKARGVCNNHYKSERKAGRLPTKSPADRFWSKVDKTDGCWLWTGTVNWAGYGQFRYGARLIMAHRWAYEEMVGPIAEGLVIDHLCRTPTCVNPSHLEPVTERENIVRGVGPSAQNAGKTHCIRGHPFDEDNTYRTPVGDRGCKMCRAAAMRLFYDRQKASA